MKPIRVLHVIGSMNCGGAETLIMNLFRNIDREKVVFDFIVHTTEEAFYDKEIESLGGRIFRLTKFNGKNPIQYYKKALLFFKEHPEIKIVHGHIGSSAALYLEAAKKNNCITIAHSHSTGNGIKNIHDVFYTVYSYPTRFVADYFFGCSTEAGKKRYGEKIVNSKKYRNIANAVEVRKFTFNEYTRNEIRKQLGITNNFVVGTVGRITEAKNPLFIVDIFREYKKINQDSILLWVGDGELKEHVKSRIHEYSLDSDVILLGQRENVNEYLMAMDVFLFPSKWEGLPTSVVEAQATGLNCVLSNNITHEVELTNLVTWMDLTNPPKEWAERIKDIIFLQRQSRIQEVREAGYDILQQSSEIQLFYEYLLKDALGE